MSVNSKFEQWEAVGGVLTPSRKRKLQNAKCYPYLFDPSGQPIKGKGYSPSLYINVVLFVVVAGMFLSYITGGFAGSPDLDFNTQQTYRPTEIVRGQERGSFRPTELPPDRVLRVVPVVSANDPTGSGKGSINPYDWPEDVTRPELDMPQLEPSPPVAARTTFNATLYSYHPPADKNYCLTYDSAANDCLSMMANGEDWRLYNQNALACPRDWLGLYIQIPDLGTFQCKDTGTTVSCDFEHCKLYFLDSSLSWSGQQVHATILFSPADG